MDQAQFAILKTWATIEDNVNKVLHHPLYVKYTKKAKPWWPSVGRVMICMHFLNDAYGQLMIYHGYGSGTFPFLGYFLIIPTVAVLFNWKTEIFGVILALLACVEAR